MLKRIKNIFAVLLILLLYGCSAKIDNLDSQGKNIICFGDSLTAGAGAQKGKDYPSVLSNLLGRKVINAGVSADTTKMALNRLKEDVLEKDPLLVIILLGGNDSLRRISKEETKNNLQKIIREIKQYNSMVAVCDISDGMIMSSYRKIFRRIAKDNRVIFIPKVLTGILTNPALKSDYIHPNSKGYNIIAQRIYKVINSYLSLN